LKVILLLKTKETYALYENFMYTGLPPVPSLCHFVLTPAALITPALYSLAIVSAGILFSAMASAGSW